MEILGQYEGILIYLCQLVDDYFIDRSLIFDSDDRQQNRDGIF